MKEYAVQGDSVHIMYNYTHPYQRTYKRAKLQEMTVEQNVAY